MDPEQRRAHLILHGQTLLDAWTERCRLYAEGDKRYHKGIKRYDEGNKLCDEGNAIHDSKLYDEGLSLCDEGGKLFSEGDMFYSGGDDIFRDAVRAEFGGIFVDVSEEGSCTLGNGEVYRYEPVAGK